MRSKIVAGNWKMNKTLQEGFDLAASIKNILPPDSKDQPQVILFTPYIHFTSVKPLLNKGISLGAQNCSEKPSGAYTGEISASMIKSCGCTHVLVGHSERRQYFKESEQVLIDKVKLALENEIIPVFCCGENLEERENGMLKQVISNQLKELLKLEIKDIQKCIIAYEPVWAIGTGKTATAAQAQEVHKFIRSLLAAAYDETLAESISILYGGSCNPTNAAELFSQKDIDGGLIGGASLVAADFIKIINSFKA